MENYKVKSAKINTDSQNNFKKPNFVVVDDAEPHCLAPNSQGFQAFIAAVDYLLKIHKSPRALKNAAHYLPTDFEIKTQKKRGADGVEFDVFQCIVKREKSAVAVEIPQILILNLMRERRDRNRGDGLYFSERGGTIKLLTYLCARAGDFNKSRGGEIEFDVTELPEGILDSTRGTVDFIKAVGALLCGTTIESAHFAGTKKAGGIGRILNGFNYERRKLWLSVEKGNPLYKHFFKYFYPLPLAAFKSKPTEFNLLLKVLSRGRQNSTKIARGLLCDAAGYSGTWKNDFESQKDFEQNFVARAAADFEKKLTELSAGLDREESPEAAARVKNELASVEKELSAAPKRAARIWQSAVRRSQSRAKKQLEKDLTAALDRVGWAAIFQGDFVEIKTEPRQMPQSVPLAPDFVVADAAEFEKVNRADFLDSVCDGKQTHFDRIFNFLKRRRAC